MSKSTSINDLPKNESNKDEDVQESMMVNSILKEIENEEEVLNDENEESLNYIMDTSQIPPKIQNEIPTPEIIKATTEDLFNPDNLPPMETMPIVEEKKEQKELNNLLNKVEVSKESTKLGFLPDINNIKKRVIGPVVMLLLFMILTYSKVNVGILKILPKLRSASGDIGMLGNLLKGLLIAMVHFFIVLFMW